MDALAVVYARELTRWGIETSTLFQAPSPVAPIISHMPVLRQTRHESPNTRQVLTRVSQTKCARAFASIVPADADVAAVADAIVKVVDTPFGKRPFRVHIDPTQDGAEVVNMVSDRVRAELLRRIGLGDLLTPRDSAVELQSAA
jgi:hypothetical protein